MEIFHQLGQLFLEAVPTVIIVFLFYLFLSWSFFVPIEKVLHQRRARLEGARREAEAFRARAADRQRTDQDALRQARAGVFNEQEAARRVVLDERTAAIQQARSRANEEVHAAKKRIAAEIDAARGELEASGNVLAEQIVQAILDSRPPDLRPAGGAR